MIGNDVIDIKQARQESNWQRPGFLDKLFTKNELGIIMSNPDQELMVWVLWSMKEAAYKIYNRQTHIRAFIPHKLYCYILNCNNHAFTGLVKYKHHAFCTKSVIIDTIVYTTAATSHYDLDKISEIYPKTILKDSYGLPYASCQGRIIPVSVSHHGRATQIVALNN